MATYIVVGKSERVVTAVLQALYTYSKKSAIVIGNDETRKLRFSMLCAKHFHLDFDGRGDDKAILLINHICKSRPDTVVIAADCEGIRLVNRIRDRVDVKTSAMPDGPALELMDNKWRFYQFCQDHQLSVPDTCYIGSKDKLDFNEVVARLGLPFVLKPANESGSYGVQIIASEAQFRESVERNPQYRFTTLIAQQYIDGDDIDLSLLSIKGRIAAVAVQQVDGAAVRFMQHPEFEQVAAKLCAASAFHGVMHIDARIERKTGRLFLIESNPRYWASLTAAVWCGLNFVAEGIQQSIAAGSVKRLVNGTAGTRHPLLRPSSWSHMLGGRGAQGRLARASTFDPFSLGRFAGEFPVMSCRYVVTRAAKGFKALRRNYIQS